MSSTEAVQDTGGSPEEQAVLGRFGRCEWGCSVAELPHYWFSDAMHCASQKGFGKQHLNEKVMSSVATLAAEVFHL